jgi:hypothetical protein
MNILILATEPDWLGIARLPEALKRVGFRVGVMCPRGSPIGFTSFVDRRWLIDETVTTIAGTHKIIQHVVDEWLPERIVPGDDKAAHVLHNMLATRTDPGRASPLRTLLLNSLGDPERYREIMLKSALPETAGACAVEIPPALVLPGDAEAAAFVQEHAFPVMLKPDFGVAGSGLAFCQTDGELREHLERLRANKRAAFTLQKFIEGQSAGVSCVASQGRLLEAIIYASDRRVYDYGPTAVSRRLDRPDIIAATGRLIRHFGFNGFAGLDFIIEGRTGKALLLEFNPRPAPMAARAHLMGVDLAGAYMAALTNTEPQHCEAVTGMIALFPQEWMRDPESPFLHTAWHDVPWNDPELLQHLVGRCAKKPAHVHSEILGLRS